MEHEVHYNDSRPNFSTFPEATHVHLITVRQDFALQPKKKGFLPLLAVKFKLFDASLKQN